MDIHSKEMTELIQGIADKYDLEFDITKKIIMSQFECVRANMKKADSYNDHFPYIKLLFLFTFKVTARKRKLLVEKAKRILADVYIEEQQAGD